MVLFTSGKRTDRRGYSQRETRFQYLDRSARSEAASIRRRLSAWLACYPKKHQSEWIARFSSRDDIAHSSAFFELYLYSYFTRLGFSVEVAPGSQDGKVKAPDFKVSSKKHTFFVEATTGHDETHEERLASKRQAVARNAIDGINNDEFLVSLTWVDAPMTQPIPRQVAASVSQWLSALNYDELRPHRDEEGFKLPTREFAVAGGRLRIDAWPKSTRKRTSGLLASEGGGIRQVNAHVAIRKALDEKSSRYCDLNLPYIVAINVHSGIADHDDFADAVYGTPEVAQRPDGRMYMRYGGDGGFGHSRRAKARRVSAALCVRDIQPWTIGQEHNERQLCLLHHPQCFFPLDREVIPVAESWVDGNAVRTSRGRLARTVLGIRKDWPGDR